MPLSLFSFASSYRLEMDFWLQDMYDSLCCKERLVLDFLNSSRSFCSSFTKGRLRGKKTGTEKEKVTPLDGSSESMNRNALSFLVMSLRLDRLYLSFVRFWVAE